MSKPVVLLDCDGVLADTVDLIIRRAKLNKLPSDFTDWDLGTCLTAEEQLEVRRVMRLRGFAEDIAWYAQAGRFFTLLREMAEVIVVTSHMPNWRWWLRERLQWFVDGCSSANAFPLEDVCFMDGKHKHRIKADFLIEDHPGTCYRWAEEWYFDAPAGRGLAVLLARDWSFGKEYTGHPGVYIAQDYGAVLDVICPSRDRGRDEKWGPFKCPK